MKIVKSYLEFLNEDVVSPDIKKLADGICQNLLSSPGFINLPFLRDTIQKFESTPDGKIFNIIGKKGEICQYSVDKNYWYNVHSETPQDKGIQNNFIQYLNKYPNYIKLVKPAPTASTTPAPTTPTTPTTTEDSAFLPAQSNPKYFI